MSEISKRLRKHARYTEYSSDVNVMKEGAEEIERLERELETARATPAQPVPVEAYAAEDGVEHSHPQYGRGVFFTFDCAKELYENPPEVSESDVSAPSPSSVGAAIRALPLPELIYSFSPEQVRALLSEAAALAEQVQGQQINKDLLEALRIIVNGTPLDQWNRDDDGLDCCYEPSMLSKQSLNRWRQIGQKAIDAAAPSIAQDGQGGGDA